MTETDIGKYMLRARRKASLTLRQLSEKSGIAASTIMSWEHNNAVPNVFSCSKVAGALGLTIDEYIHGYRRPLR